MRCLDHRREMTATPILGGGESYQCPEPGCRNGATLLGQWNGQMTYAPLRRGSLADLTVFRDLSGEQRNLLGALAGALARRDDPAVDAALAEDRASAEWLARVAEGRKIIAAEALTSAAMVQQRRREREAKDGLTHADRVRIGFQKSKHEARVCANARCGAAFDPSSPAQKYCQRSCTPSQLAALPIGDRVCVLPSCGRTFAPKTSTQRFCSRSCTRLRKAIPDGRALLHRGDAV